MDRAVRRRPRRARRRAASARASTRRAPISARVASGVMRASGPAMLTAATASPAAAEKRSPDAGAPSSFSSTSETQPLRRHPARIRSIAAESVVVRSVGAASGPRLEDLAADGGRLMGEQRPAAGRRVVMGAGARVGGHAQALRPLQAVDDHRVGGAGQREVHRLARRGAEAHESGPQMPDEVDPAFHGAAVDQLLEAEPVALAAVALDEADIDKRRHEIEGGRLREPRPRREVAQRNGSAVCRGQHVQDRLGPPDRLDPRGGLAGGREQPGNHVHQTPSRFRAT